MTPPTSRALPLLAPPLRALAVGALGARPSLGLGARPRQGAALHMAKTVHEGAADDIIDEVPALETTLGQMTPPKSGRVQECHLIQVAL